MAMPQGDNSILNRLWLAFVKYDRGMTPQIQHAIKVTGFAKMIVESEGMDAREKFVLEAAAILHDVGIRESRLVYGDGAGNHQEELGPAVARSLMEPLEFDAECIARVEWLIAHHHHVKNIDALDWQILVEADFLVNAFEENSPKDVIVAFRDKVFKTKTGIDLLNEEFDLTE